MSLDIYSEIILDHFKNPHNFGKLENADAHAKDVNPSCGDEIEIFMKVKDKKIAEVKFEGRGCAISQASASMLTDELKGKSVGEAARLENNFVLDLLGVNLSAMRVKCAMLPLNVLKTAATSCLKK